MARFRAYTSDSSSEDEEEQQPRYQEPKAITSGPPVEESAEEDEEEEESSDESESSSSESSSGLVEEELRLDVHRPVARKPNALIEDEDGEIRYAHEVEAEEEENAIVPSSRTALGRGTTIIPWAQQIGVDAQKMHVMQASLFRMPEEAEALKDLEGIVPKRVPKGLNIYGSYIPAQTKPKARKYGPEADADSTRLDTRERRSFAHHIEPLMYRPSRKYARVDKTSSIANGHESSFVDAGLSFGRSFRVGWGPGGVLVHLGSICGPTFSSSTANSSAVNLTNTSAFLASTAVNNIDSNSSSPSPPVALAAKLLQHHLTLTSINFDDSAIPHASPKSLPSSTITPTSGKGDDTQQVIKYLNFASFSSLFPSNDLSGPASLFRLGVSLFDPINLHLNRSRKPSSISSSSAITPDTRHRITLLRRKAALGQWLEEVVKPSVESDLRTKANGLVSGGPYTPADTAFTHLTGHQVDKACTVAADGNHIKLSTLISQAGGDDLFKEDIREQLRIWKSDNLGPGADAGFGSGLIGRGVWKVYSLLGGVLDGDQENISDKDVDVCAGLDWKRVFGLCLWYGESLEASIADVVDAYEDLLSKRSETGPSKLKPLARPIPPWLLDVQRKKQSPSLLSKWSRRPSSTNPDDPLYALIRLYADPALSLSNILDPLCFSSAVMDFGIGMCWHLYIILSRVLRIRDFADRRPLRRTMTNGASEANHEESSSDEDRQLKLPLDGHSPTADLLSSTYAFELESWGMIQEAIFVLLHIEESAGREKAVKDLLGRSAPHLDEWMTRGIVGSLKIPMSWVDEAKAQHAFNIGDFLKAYELYLSSGLYNMAHNVALLELVPDAILGRDLDLVKELFEVFDGPSRHDKIEGWFVRGKILLDYVRILTRLPELGEQVEADNEVQPAIADVMVAQEIDELTRKVPRIIGILPDIFYRTWTSDPRHPATVEEMTKSLLSVTEKTKPVALMQIQQATLPSMDGASKVGLMSSAGLARFIKNIQV